MPIIHSNPTTTAIETLIKQLLKQTICCGINDSPWPSWQKAGIQKRILFPKECLVQAYSPNEWIGEFSFHKQWQWVFMEWKYLFEEDIGSHQIDQYWPWVISDFSFKNFYAVNSSIQCPILFSSYSFPKGNLCYLHLLVKGQASCLSTYEHICWAYMNTWEPIVMCVHSSLATWKQAFVAVKIFTSQHSCWIPEPQKKFGELK